MEEQFDKLTVGRIVWAALPDSNGNDCGPHRFVIVAPPPTSHPQARLAVVGISTRRPEKECERFCVKLKYMSRPGGHPETGLNQECFAHCLWIQITTISALTSLGGRVGEKAMYQIRAILDDAGGAEVEGA